MKFEIWGSFDQIPNGNRRIFLSLIISGFRAGFTVLAGAQWLSLLPSPVGSCGSIKLPATSVDGIVDVSFSIPEYFYKVVDCMEVNTSSPEPVIVNIIVYGIALTKL